MTDGDRPPEGSRAPSDVRARRMVALAMADDGAAEPEAVLQRVCRAAARALSMRGSVIHLVTAAGVSGAVASSDQGSRLIADLAFTTGEGPTMDAVTYRRPVLASDLGQDPRRWPGFTHAAVEVGVLAVFCLPLQIGGVTLGVLDLYADRVRGLTASDFDLASSFAQLAAQALLGEPPGEPGDAAWEPLLDHRAEVHQAQGMVMVDLGIDLAEALLRMRAFAFAEGIALIDLAQAIIAGFMLPFLDGEQA